MITFQTFYTEKECKELWKKYSPNKHLWDIWEFRHCFHTENFEFNFISCYDEDLEVAVLPLVFDRKSKIYTFFGDTFPERNKTLVADEEYREYNYDLFYQVPYHTSIYYLDKNEAMYFDEFNKGEKRYFLNLEKYNSFDEYLITFSKKHRKNLKYDLKKIQDLDPAIEINKQADFNTLIAFNKERFGKDSDYHDPLFVKSMEKLIATAKKKKMLDMITVRLNDKIEAVGLGIIYNKIYYVLNSGRNLTIKNLGKFLIGEQIKRAIETECDEIDFLSTEAVWKELWNLEHEDTYEFYG